MDKQGVCEVFCFDEQKVLHLQQQIQASNITASVKLFKVLADENKAKILYTLSLERELCVCDLAQINEISIANTSFHLRALFKQSIVTYRKEGKLAFYSLQDDNIKKLISTIVNKN